MIKIQNGLAFGAWCLEFRYAAECFQTIRQATTSPRSRSSRIILAAFLGAWART
jgi:hypothetical protein